MARGGQITLADGDPDQISPNGIASITKMMTAWVVMKHLSTSQLDDNVTMISQDFHSYSGSRFRSGDILSYRELLLASATRSDNTAPFTLARAVGNIISSGGGVSRFVQEMNDEASNLMYSGASFTTPWNLGRMSPRQVADLLRRVLDDSTLAGIFGTKSTRISVGGPNSRSVLLEHTIHRFSVEPVQGWVAGKTGTWQGNGHLAIAWDHPSGDEHITVILDAISDGAPRYNRLQYVRDLTAQ